ncbi:Uncharacterised protein g8942 [Pycnogonum litorale]
MGCGGSKATGDNAKGNHNPQLAVTSVSTPQPVPEPVSFEIPLNDNEESLVKKHPPLKFQRLQEQEKVQLTKEEIEAKAHEAEIRRNSHLQERVRSCRVNIERVRTKRVTDPENIEKIEEENETGTRSEW